MASDVEASDFFLATLGIIWGSVASVVFWDTCLNMNHKLELMNHYDSSGVDTMAMVLRQQITIHRTNFVETHRTQTVTYAYMVPGSESRVIVKDYVKNQPRGFVTPTAGLFAVKVLPGFPLSGRPIFEIDNRDSDFGACAKVKFIVFSLAFVIAGAAMLLSLPSDFRINPPGLQLVLSVIGFLLFGAPFAPCMRNSWEKNHLHKCSAELPVLPGLPGTTTAEATIVPHGDEAHTAFATAVLVGDVEMAESGNDVAAPPLPDTLAETIMDEAKNRSFRTIVARLDDFRQGAWDLRSSYVSLAASHWSGKTLTPLVGCPDTAVGNLFRGAYYINRAWDVRGSAEARRVQRSAWPEFHRGLHIAQESLLRAAEQDPEDPTPYALLTGAVCKGLELSQEQAFEWFTAAIARDPFNRPAHFARLSALCEKWGGSHEAMFAFARGTVQRCPDDSPLRVILLDAFYEKWLFVNNFDGNRRKAKDYLRNPKLRDEVLVIYQQCLQDRVIEDISQVSVHASATKFLLLAGFETEARRELQKLYPWRKMLCKDPGVLANALRDPNVVGQCARDLARDLRF
jgi:hypothetical protein